MRRWLPALLLAAGRAYAAPEAQDWTCPELALLAPDASQEDKRITCEIPAEFRRQVAEAQLEGRKLRAHDGAAWTSTDALKKLHAFDKLPGTSVGWLTREAGDAIDISYFAEVDGEPRAYAEARFDRRKQRITRARRLSTLRLADEREKRLLAAKQTALDAPRLQCSRTLNTVVFEEEGFDEIRVYLFSAWEQDGLLPMGGHSRFRISSDGKRILETLQQTKSCLRFDEKKAKSEFGFITDLVDESPSGMQVFMQIQYDVPVVTVTEVNNRIWKIENGRIHTVSEDDEGARTIRAWLAKRDADASNPADKPAKEAAKK